MEIFKWFVLLFFPFFSFPFFFLVPFFYFFSFPFFSFVFLSFFYLFSFPFLVLVFFRSFLISKLFLLSSFLVLTPISPLSLLFYFLLILLVFVFSYFCCYLFLFFSSFFILFFPFFGFVVVRFSLFFFLLTSLSGDRWIHGSVIVSVSPVIFFPCFCINKGLPYFFCSFFYLLFFLPSLAFFSVFFRSFFSLF